MRESLEHVRVPKWRFPFITKYFTRDDMLLEYSHCNSLYLKAKVIIIIFSFLRKMYEKVCFVQKTKNVPNFGTENYFVKIYKLNLSSNYRSSDLSLSLRFSIERKPDAETNLNKSNFPIHHLSVLIAHFQRTFDDET